MIKELISISQSDLLEALVQSNYSFACWRLPKANSLTLAISLQSPEMINTNLGAVEPGFIVNRFEDNHPVNPQLIQADILLHERHVQIRPNVSSDKFDDFFEHIDSVRKNQIPKSKGHKSPQSDSFGSLVEKALESISTGQFEKVVLARFEDQSLPSSFDLVSTFELITKTYPLAFCSLFTLGDGQYWMGASPELLLSANDETFETVSLAGTKGINVDQSLNEIAWTQKEIEEQAFVSRYIINCFKKIRLREFHEHGPKSVRAGNLAHLKTTYSVQLKDLQFQDLADQMVELLHPTSAVCGMPLEPAYDFIKKHEDFDREFYAGFLGPVNIDCMTHLFVNLRCVKIHNGQVRYFAGAGITGDSRPDHELEETNLKMAVMRDLIQK